GEPLLALQRPVPIRLISPSPTEPDNKSQLQVSNLSITGEDRELTFEADLRWPDQGRSAGTVRGIALNDLRDFLPPKWSGVRIDDLRFNTAWQHGPATLFVSARGSYA